LGIFGKPCIKDVKKVFKAFDIASAVELSMK